MKKLTKREKFEMLRNIPEVQASEMLMEFIDNELDLLARKNSSEKKPTAAQLVNETTKNAILEFLTENRKVMTITDLIKECPACADQSNQRINALVRQMVPEKLERVVIKRRAYFCIPEVAEEMEKAGE